MYMMKCAQGEKFCDGELQRFGNIELSPSAGILNYGQVSSSTLVMLDMLLNYSSFFLMILGKYFAYCD